MTALFGLFFAIFILLILKISYAALRFASLRFGSDSDNSERHFLLFI
jgi:hypothetical protein